MKDKEANAALTILNRIDSKLDVLVARLNRVNGQHNRGASESRASRAAKIAEMTPAGVPQTDSVKLLRQDRAR